MSCMRCGYDDYDCVCGTEHEHNTMETIILRLRTQLATEKERADEEKERGDIYKKSFYQAQERADRSEAALRQACFKLSNNDEYCHMGADAIEQKMFEIADKLSDEKLGEING